MSIPAPPVDARSAADVAAQVQTLLYQYVPDLDPPTAGQPPGMSQPTGISKALVGVFSRFSELIIQRLNQAPDKNLLAFLDLIGASLLPPQPASAPLTFTLAEGAMQALVPAGTQVAAPPGPDGEPIVFETERPLTLTPASLSACVTWDPVQDQWRDLGMVLQPGEDSGELLFQGDHPVERSVYFSHPQFGFQSVFYMTVSMDGARPQPADSLNMLWEVWTGSGGIGQGVQFTPNPKGEDVKQFNASGNFTLSGPVAAPLKTVAGIAGNWLRMSTQAPITQLAAGESGKVRLAQLPTIRSLKFLVFASGTALAPEASFCDSNPVDCTRKFRLFGASTDASTYDSVWYVAGSPMQLLPDQSITLTFTSRLSSQYTASGDTTFVWEYWNGSDWIWAGEKDYDANASAGITPARYPAGGYLQDQTNCLTGVGNVVLQFPTPPQPTVVNGVLNYWLRLRCDKGGFKSAIQFDKLTLCKSVNGGVQTAVTPQAVVVDNGGEQTIAPAANFQPFVNFDDAACATYFALSKPDALDELPQQTISLYFEFSNVLFGRTPEDPPPVSDPILFWEYWNGSAWTRLPVADDTGNFTRSGTLELLPPDDWSARALFGKPAALWLRARLASGGYKFLPRLKFVLLNTVTGTQGYTQGTEVLGSGTGEASQSFFATKSPVLDGPVVEVFEAELPPAAERTVVEAEEGVDAITAMPGGARVRWHQVTDFNGSGPRDRHYLLNNVSGEILFGDGVYGLAPPRGAGNIQLTSYRTGGGEAGNVAMGAVNQLKATIPYVDQVANPSPGAGGVGTESNSALIERAPKTLRHGGRAVTREDFEDLAKLASTEVARARCVPLYDLSVDRLAVNRLPGTVSLILVPRSDSPVPYPSAELMRRVQQQLDGARLPGVSLVLIGPDYLIVSVTTELSLTSLDAAGEVQFTALAQLQSFLHALTGGRDGNGWDFGRQPHKSDLYALLEAMPGVDYVKSLSITTQSSLAGIENTDRFLVCSGQHSITLTAG